MKFHDRNRKQMLDKGGDYVSYVTLVFQWKFWKFKRKFWDFVRKKSTLKCPCDVTFIPRHQRLPAFDMIQYLRHETTEKRDRIAAYQPYLSMAWVKETRGRCRRGRWAYDVCWWSQHSHQTLEAFNFRQRFGNFLKLFVGVFVVWKLVKNFLFCSFFLIRFLSIWNFSLPFTWFSRLLCKRVCDILSRISTFPLSCYTSANFSFCFFSFFLHKTTRNCCGVKQFSYY